jgi:hypothetical protein
MSPDAAAERNEYTTSERGHREPGEPRSACLNAPPPNGTRDLQVRELPDDRVLERGDVAS